MVVAPRATSSSIARSVTARQWHTYTTPRLGEPHLIVKAPFPEPDHPPRRWAWIPTGLDYGAAVVVADPGVEAIVIFLIVTFFVGGPSPLDGYSCPIF